MQVSVLAPDLRGRGDSAALPGPYGIAAHVADLISVLDHLDVERVVLVGHSMGAYVAARIAAEHPARAAGLVLVDGGTPSDLTEEAASGAHAFLVGPALVRQAMPFMSAQAYLAFWQQHPAFAPAWNDDVEGYVLHDLHGRPGAFRYIVSVEALHADSGDMLSDPANQPAIKAEMPLYVLRARRGLLGDENPLIPQATWDAFITEHPTAHVEDVASVSHYSLVLGDSAGPQRVTAAILAAARAATSA
jgi:pimeloyl-ACP methyl ester carboxylesterase